MGTPVLVRTVQRAARVTHRYMVTGRFRADPAPIIERFFGGKECFFVHVGSNDGVTGDPLHPLIAANPKARGIFIEPQPSAFARLLANYAPDSRFAFEQTAVSDARGECRFYTVATDIIRARRATESLDFGGSFNRQHVLRHIEKIKTSPKYAAFKDDAETYLVATMVRCEPLMSLLDRHRVERVDVLVVDAETYDYQILRQIDFTRLRPTLILYEHKYLTSEDANAATSLLSREGYHLVNCGRDTLAVRSDS